MDDTGDIDVPLASQVKAAIEGIEHPVATFRDFDASSSNITQLAEVNGIWILSAKPSAGNGIPSGSFQDNTGGNAPDAVNGEILLPAGSMVRVFSSTDLRLIAIPRTMEQVQEIVNGIFGDGSVTFAKIADGAVGPAKLANSAVEEGKIKDGAVSETKLSSDVQTTLSGKANTADLATVATSGSYNDLSDKPEGSSPTADTIATVLGVERPGSQAAIDQDWLANVGSALTTIALLPGDETLPDEAMPSEFATSYRIYGSELVGGGGGA